MSDHKPPFYVPEPVGADRACRAHEWPYNRPIPDGYTQLTVWEGCFWIIVRDDLLDSPAAVDEILAGAKAATRRSWNRWRMAQRGMAVLDGGKVVRS